MSERWLPVRGWESCYEVSDLGRVRSIERPVSDGMGGTYLKPGKLLSPRSQMHGYLVVKLRNGRGAVKSARVHRLVAEAFLPNNLSKPQVNHIDCNRANNARSNLEWSTQAENLSHMDALGRRSKYWSGKRSPNASLSKEQVQEIRLAYQAGEASQEKLGHKYGVSKKTITNVVNRKTYGDV